jgi:hypothetical protein
MRRPACRKCGRRTACAKCRAPLHPAWRKIKPSTPVKQLRSASRRIANCYRQAGLLMPQPCEECGAFRADAVVSKAFVEMHHDDYLRPLAVRWLCHRCHCKHHGLGFKPLARSPALLAALDETWHLSDQAVADRLNAMQIPTVGGARRWTKYIVMRERELLRRRKLAA